MSDLAAVASEYRRLTRDELDTVVGWAAAEGWNPGPGDAAAFWATDPEGFWGFDVDGELAGAGAIVAYGDAAGFMGLYLVRADLRGRGLGGPFWHFRRDTLRARLRPDAPVSMDGVFAMQPFYAAGGFSFSHRNLRMTGVPVGLGSTSSDLVELGHEDLDEATALDTSYVGVSRRAFLEHWLPPVGGRAYGLRRDGSLVAYGAIRPCVTGWKVGPLFAPDPADAEDLFAALVEVAAGDEVSLDTPENNAAALDLAARHGLSESFGCARMVLGPPPATRWDAVYGVTTFELG